MRRALGAVVIAAACLALLELVASFVVPSHGEFTVVHPVLDHAWPAGGEWTHAEWVAGNPAYPVPYVHRYNAQGWLETYDVSEQKPAGTCRVFYVGDSFVEGTTPMERSVPSLVEQHLNGELATDLRFEVINTGTSSYSPVIEDLLIRTVISRFEPDAIVLCVDMTDVFDDWKYRQQLVTDADGTALRVEAVPPYGRPWMDTAAGAIEIGVFARANLFLFVHSHLYRALDLARFTGPLIVEGAPVIRSRMGWMEEPWSEDTERDVVATLTTLDGIVRFCRARGIRLMLTGVPRHGQFPHGGRAPELSPRPHAELAAFCAQRGVPYLDSLSALAPKLTDSAYTDYYYHQDMHFNPRGYEVWARAHIEALTDPANEMLPGSAREAR